MLSGMIIIRFLKHSVSKCAIAKGVLHIVSYCLVMRCESVDLTTWTTEVELIAYPLQARNPILIML